MNRETAIRIFEHLDEQGFATSIHTTHVPSLVPDRYTNVGVTVQPCDSENLKRLEEALRPFDVDYSADSFTPNFAGGVTFSIREKQ